MCQPTVSPWWLALLLTKSGDIELNPGPRIIWNSKYHKPSYTYTSPKPSHHSTSTPYTPIPSPFTPIPSPITPTSTHPSTSSPNPSHPSSSTPYTPIPSPFTPRPSQITPTSSIFTPQPSQISLKSNTPYPPTLHHYNITPINLNQPNTPDLSPLSPNYQASPITPFSLSLNYPFKNTNRFSLLTEPEVENNSSEDDTIEQTNEIVNRKHYKNDHKTVYQSTKQRNTKHYNKVYTSKPKLSILQLNINGLQNKQKELTELATELTPDLIAIQETKLKNSSKTPNIPKYTPIRQDRIGKEGGGLITYIREELTFSTNNTPIFTHTKIECQSINLHCRKSKYHLVNTYIPPREPHTKLDLEDNDINTFFNFLSNYDNNIILGDFNAHADLWYSSQNDHRGKTIETNVLSTNLTCLNKDIPTRIPSDINQRNTSPDLTLVSQNLSLNTHWNTLHKLNSDHLPILTNIESNLIPIVNPNKATFVNYKKTDWKKFSAYIEEELSKLPQNTNIHTKYKNLVKIILDADKKFIPKGFVKDNKKEVLQ